MSGNAGSRKDFASLKAELLKARSLYVDPEFPPNNKSLTYNGGVPEDLDTVVWKRPTDLVRNPRLVVGGSQYHDLDQGYLGNCWFVAAAATVAATHRRQFYRVVPHDQSFSRDYAGIFHFYFWWYGSWREVVVDDYLPTDGYQLIYCRNKEQPNEFWAALLEKAYAKLRGCYEGLDGGKLQDALVDMTGGISEVLDLRNRKDLPSDIYRLLTASFNMNSLLGASIFRPKNATKREIRKENGLYMGHAYSVTALKELSAMGRTYQLMRMRNPWGKGEWNGPWSDDSMHMRNLPERLKQEMGFQSGDDGEFWISFEDVLANFDEIQMCHLQPDALTGELAVDDKKQHWNVTVFHDAWIPNVTAGGCGNPPYEEMYWKNPQFHVELSDGAADRTLSRNRGLCTLIVSLMEKEKDSRNLYAIGFNLYQLKRPELRPLDGQRASRNAMVLRENAGTYQFYREVTRRFQLPAGHYVIIPATFYPGEEAGFLLRIFTENHIESGVLTEETPEVAPVMSGKEQLLEEVFSKHAGHDARMDTLELKSFLSDMAMKELKTRMEWSTETCRSLLSMQDRKRSGFLEVLDAQQLWREVKTYRDVFRDTDIDNTGSVDIRELGVMFAKLEVNGSPFPGFPVSQGLLRSIIMRYGGRDGRILLEDFIVIVCKLILMYNVFLEHQKERGSRNGVAMFTRDEFLEYTMMC